MCESNILFYLHVLSFCSMTSGYTQNLEKQSTAEFIWRKIWTSLLALTIAPPSLLWSDCDCQQSPAIPVSWQPPCTSHHRRHHHLFRPMKEDKNRVYHRKYNSNYLHYIRRLWSSMSQRQERITCISFSEPWQLQSNTVLFPLHHLSDRAQPTSLAMRKYVVSAM